MVTAEEGANAGQQAPRPNEHPPGCTCKSNLQGSNSSSQLRFLTSLLHPTTNDHNKDLDDLESAERCIVCAIHGHPAEEGGNNIMSIELPPEVLEELNSAHSSSTRGDAADAWVGILPSSKGVGSSKKHKKRKDAHPTQRPREVKSTTSQSSSKSSSMAQLGRGIRSRNGLIAILIGMVGMGASALILGAGIRSANQDQELKFLGLGAEIMNQFERAVADYVTAGLWVHQACFQRTRTTMTHREFRVVYEYLVSTGLEFQALSFVQQVNTPAEREALENRTRAFVQEEHPELTYPGFVGFNTVGQPPGPRNVSDSYLAVQFVEPFEDPKNKAALTFDIATSRERKKAAELALETYKPAMTERLKLLKESVDGTEQYAYTSILFHPGVPLSNATPSAVAEGRPRDLALTVVRIPDALVRARQNLKLKHHASLYIYDSTPEEVKVYDGVPPFLGGALFHSDDEFADTNELVQFSNELNLTDLKASSYRYIYEHTLPIASRQWTFVVVGHNDTFEPDVIFVAIGAAMIFVASLCLSAWIVTNHRKLTQINKLKKQNEDERTQLKLEHAHRAAQSEREMNDFLSHEVRNPISAAISACFFVKSAIQQPQQDTSARHQNNPVTEPMKQDPGSTNNDSNDECATAATDATSTDTAVIRDDLCLSAENRAMIEEDVAIIDSSLQFVNDLLRNMLDMNRAKSNQMKIDFAPVDVLHDVFEPVATMLYQRGSDFEVLLECPENLVVMTDKLRLKQTCLNLGRNATKFVTTGFIRLKADVDDGNGMVRLYIEDSGTGIPMEKRNHLFGKFQDALDSCGQGTGLGLSLCQKLVDLMHGHLWLDESYDSGVEGNPGARFVISLNKKPLDIDSVVDYFHDDGAAAHVTFAIVEGGRTLPENLSVLFVDDDWKLRTLFSRAVTRVTKGWNISQASSGETAIQMAQKQHFDIIFMDQNMSSVVKQLLGTETVQALRAQGITSVICGLSANDVERPFQKAGADMFVMKPLPTMANELTQLLFKILNSSSTIKPPALASASNNRNPVPGASAGLTVGNPAKSPHGSVLGKEEPADSETNDSTTVSPRQTNTSDSKQFHPAQMTLPNQLSVLYVDDSPCLRKMFCRSVEHIAHGWTVQGAESGEVALDLVKSTRFDVILLDQHMSPGMLLGTDTAKALRANGVASIICGLSGDDIESRFMDAGANCFMMKPFPCDTEGLSAELNRILASSTFKNTIEV